MHFVYTDTMFHTQTSAMQSYHAGKEATPNCGKSQQHPLQLVKLVWKFTMSWYRSWVIGKNMAKGSKCFKNSIYVFLFFVNASNSHISELFLKTGIKFVTWYQFVTVAVHIHAPW